METWFDRKRLTILGGVLVLAAVAVFFGQKWFEKKEQEGKSALYRVQKSLEEEQATLTEAEKAPGVALDVDARFPRTVAGLNDLLTGKTGGGRESFQAGVTLGSLYLDHLQTEKAQSVLEAGAAAARTSLQKASSRYLLGLAYEQGSKFKEALGSFESALSENVDGLKADLLLGAVRVSLAAGDSEKAKKFAERLSKDLPGSPASETAEALVKEAQ
jgi:tetratricopeptide (TPR) repeat protein